jgi:replicative DNA helicase
MSAASISAERAVIGALLADALAFARVASLLDAEDFETASARSCWGAAGRLARASKPIEFLTVTADLECAGELAGIGGTAAVAELAEGLPDPANVEHYAAIVADAARKRRLGKFAAWLVDAAARPEGSGEDLAGEAASRLAALGGRSVSRDAEDVGAIAARELTRIENIATDGQVGLALGYRDLDYTLAGGLEPGSLTILAARVAVGKTALLGGIATNACEHGKRVMLFSLEMPREAIVRRLLAALACVPLSSLRLGRLDDDAWARLAWAQDRLDDWHLVIDDTPAVSTDQVLARARRQGLVGELDLVLVDYLQKCAARGENRTQQVGAIARGLKDVARALGVPVISAAQLSRLNVREDRRPALSDLRDSGEIEQEADNVLLMHPVASETGARIVQVEIAKQRNGPTGLCKLVFTEDVVRFDDYRGDK